MSIFKKNVTDVESDEEVVEVIKKVRKAETEETKKSKKKKEPPKPWGRKERLMVLGLLVLTAGTSFILALSAREWKLPGLPRLALPSISIFKESTIVIEGDNVYQKMLEKAENIEKSLNGVTNEKSGVYGLYVIDLKSGFTFGENESETFQAASLIKLPVIAAAFKESEKGNLDLDEEYLLKESDKVGGAGSLYYKQAGYAVTYREMLKLMGKESDNTAFSIIRNKLRDDVINSYIVEFGMRDTDLEENTTSPTDIGKYFRDLYEGKLVSDSSKNEILDNLTDTSYENWIPAGVPDDIRVSHKYGREVHVVNDAGIVFTESPYVIVLTSKGVVEKEADELLPDVSRLVYEEMIR